MRLSFTSLVLLLGILSSAAAQDNTVPKGYFSGDPLPPSTIYLTFDDGPAPDTDKILDILKEKGVRATFFLNAFDRKLPAREIGKSNRFIQYQDVLRRMVAEGHVLGNHTFSHRDLATLNPDQINWQLDMVQKCLNDALGSDAPELKLIRPPFGSPWNGTWNTAAQRQKVAAILGPRGFVINWTNPWDSSDSIDWLPSEERRMTEINFVPSADYTKKIAREMHRLLVHADGKASAIVLFHDTHPTVLDVLGIVIDKYKALGYSFGTLDEYCAWRWGDGTASPSAPQ